MLLIPVLTYEIVSVSFSPEAVVCSWIQKAKLATAPLVLRAYKRYSLDNLELYKLIPFNPTILKKYIYSFLDEHNLNNAFITFSLHGPSLIERIIAMPTSTPSRLDFEINASSMQWEHRYLYPNHDGQYVFYVYAVPRSLILQYQLLAMSLHCNLITISTQKAALLHAYQNIFGIAYRKSQLAIDMMRYDNNVENLISDDALRRMISMNSAISLKDEKLFVATACGLFCMDQM